MVISRRVEASIGFENDSVVLVVEDSLEFIEWRPVVIRPRATIEQTIEQTLDSLLASA